MVTNQGTNKVMERQTRVTRNAPIEDIWLDGYTDGFKSGTEAGWENGYAQGYDEGYHAGFSDGIEEERKMRRLYGGETD